MNNPEQLPLDFHAPATDGYEVWQWDQAAAVKRIGRLWNLPLDSLVRVRLLHLDQDFTGRLRLVRRPSRPNGKEPLSLDVGGMPFLSTEIESCMVLADTNPHCRMGSREACSEPGRVLQ